MTGCIGITVHTAPAVIRYTRQTPLVVRVVDAGPARLEIRGVSYPGPRGPKGDVGDPGPQGPPGGTAYVHVQASPAATWVINHNLGYEPSLCQLFTTGGVKFDGTITHVSANQAVISLDLPMAGRSRFL